jgi:predicted nucleotidyltransferase
MPRKLAKPKPAVAMSAIRRYAGQIAGRFQPDKIILFGSYAYGSPHEDSDVDLLVIMPARNELDQAVKICWELPSPPFAMDLIVRKPNVWQRQLEDGDSFCTEILERGKVLYEKGDAALGEEGRGRSPRRDHPRRGTRPAS